MDTNHGMLFVYAQNQKPYFWMKGTAIPLSIIFIDANHIYLEHHDMDPHSTRIVSSKMPVRFALETNRGWFVNNQIKMGDRVEFKLPAGIEIR